MTGRWDCVDEPAIRAKPSEFRQIATQLTTVSGDVQASVDEAVTLAGNEPAGLVGKAADAVRLVLGAVATSLAQLPERASAASTAADAAADTLEELKGTSDALFTDATEKYAALGAARQDHDDAQRLVQLREGEVDDAQAQPDGDTSSADAQLSSAREERRLIGDRIDDLEDDLDAFETEFDTLRESELDVQTTFADAVDALQIARPSDDVQGRLAGLQGLMVDGFFDMSGIIALATINNLLFPSSPDDPGAPGGEEFVIGDPTRPNIEWDEDYIYDSESPGWRDYIAREKWELMTEGATIARSDLDDGLAMYRHYWDNNGDPVEFDYEEAYREDDGVRQSIDDAIERARVGADGLIAQGNTDFSMTGDAHANSQYPTTENWQKAIGGHQQWSSADVSVDGNTVTMTVTVHGEDHYNFNRGQADIASDAPDDENGRFTELGWAKPFDSSGSITRTITWELGSGTSSVSGGDDPNRDAGGEDRSDGRDSSTPR